MIVSETHSGGKAKTCPPTRYGSPLPWRRGRVCAELYVSLGNQVSEVVSVFPGILEANVYGVKVPGNEDGRACMAAIVTDDNKAPNFEKLYKHIAGNLASYAIPQFIRLLPEMESTGTFKQRKVSSHRFPDVSNTENCERVDQLCVMCSCYSGYVRPRRSRPRQNRSFRW